MDIMGLGVQTQPTSLNSRENSICSFSLMKTKLCLWFLFLFFPLFVWGGEVSAWLIEVLQWLFLAQDISLLLSLWYSLWELWSHFFSLEWAKSRRWTLGYNHWILFNFVCEADKLQVPLLTPDKCVKLWKHEPKNLHLDPRRMVSFVLRIMHLL